MNNAGKDREILAPIRIVVETRDGDKTTVTVGQPQGIHGVEVVQARDSNKATVRVEQRSEHGAGEHGTGERGAGVHGAGESGAGVDVQARDSNKSTVRVKEQSGRAVNPIGSTTKSSAEATLASKIEITRARNRNEQVETVNQTNTSAQSHPDFPTPQVNMTSALLQAQIANGTKPTCHVGVQTCTSSFKTSGRYSDGSHLKRTSPVLSGKAANPLPWRLELLGSREFPLFSDSSSEDESVTQVPTSSSSVTDKSGDKHDAETENKTAPPDVPVSIQTKVITKECSSRSSNLVTYDKSEAEDNVTDRKVSATAQTGNQQNTNGIIATPNDQNKAVQQNRVNASVSTELIDFLYGRPGSVIRPSGNQSSDVEMNIARVTSPSVELLRYLGTDGIVSASMYHNNMTNKTQPTVPSLQLTPPAHRGGGVVTGKGRGTNAQCERAFTERGTSLLSTDSRAQTAAHSSLQLYEANSTADENPPTAPSTNSARGRDRNRSRGKRAPPVRARKGTGQPKQKAKSTRNKSNIGEKTQAVAPSSLHIGRYGGRKAPWISVKNNNSASENIAIKIPSPWVSVEIRGRENMRDSTEKYTSLNSVTQSPWLPVTSSLSRRSRSSTSPFSRSPTPDRSRSLSRSSSPAISATSMTLSRSSSPQLPSETPSHMLSRSPEMLPIQQQLSSLGASRSRSRSGGRSRSPRRSLSPKLSPLKSRVAWIDKGGSRVRGRDKEAQPTSGAPSRADETPPLTGDNIPEGNTNMTDITPLVASLSPGAWRVIQEGDTTMGNKPPPAMPFNPGAWIDVWLKEVSTQDSSRTSAPTTLTQKLPPSSQPPSPPRAQRSPRLPGIPTRLPRLPERSTQPRSPSRSMPSSSPTTTSPETGPISHPFTTTPQSSSRADATTSQQDRNKDVTVQQKQPRPKPIPFQEKLYILHTKFPAFSIEVRNIHIKFFV